MNHIARTALTLALMVGLPAPSFAAEFFAIVEPTGKKPHAFLDVAVDTRVGVGVNVQFRAYAAQGNFLGEFFVPLNASGFASTESFGSLFDLSNNQSFLIRANTNSSTVMSSATLGLTSARGPSVALGVLPVQKLDGSLLSAGRVFSIALGSFRSTWLQIAAISGSDTFVDVFKGTDGPAGTGIYTIGRLANFGHQRINLTQNEAFSNLVVVSSAVVIVQLVIDDGKSLHSYMVTPIA